MANAERLVIRAYEMWLVENAPQRPTDEDDEFERLALEHVVGRFSMSRERIQEIIAARGVIGG